MNFTAIDFETANARRGSACEIGVVVVKNGKIANRFSHLIRPEPLHFDPRNIAIHGIYPEDVRDAPTFFQLWPELWSTFSGPIVAHNAAFDMSVLRYSLDDVGARYPETDYFCTVVMSRLAWPDYPDHKLNHVARNIGVDFNHHDAEEDAFACAQIAIAACECLGVSSLYDLPKRHGLRIGQLYAGGYRPCGGPRKCRGNT